jgi:hypothetical protein
VVNREWRSVRDILAYPSASPGEVREDPASALMSGWRDEVDAMPELELVTVDRALGLIAQTTAGA